MKSSPGPTEKLATQTANQDIASRTKSQGEADSSLSQFEGPVDQTPFYRSMVTAGTDATQHSFDSERANTRMQAHGAGFGYEQPVAQGADAQVNDSEAKAQAQVPQQALQAAAPLTMQAAGMREGEVNAYNPNGAINTAGTLEQDRLNRQNQMWQQIAKTGVSAAMPFIPGQYA